jgi:acylphosphatase
MGNTDLTSVHVVVEGYVQGVFFRAFVSRRAEELGLSGYVRNLHDREAVEVQVEGEREKLEKLISYLHVGPPSARVEMVDTNWSEYSGNYHGFSIRY